MTIRGIVLHVTAGVLLGAGVAAGQSLERAQREEIALAGEDSVAMTSSALRVRFDPLYGGPGRAGFAGYKALRDEVAALRGVTFVTREWDIRIGTPSVAVRCPCAGVFLGDVEIGVATYDEVLSFVAWEALVHELSTTSFPGQDFNVELDILELTSSRLGGGTWALCELKYSADVPAHFLLLSVESNGWFNDRRVSLVSSDGRFDGRVRWGAFLKLFAFRERPAGLGAWLPARIGRNRSIESRWELASLLRFVQKHADVAAETSFVVPD